ncbi:serine hydrolase domain-containing protein [Flagellimonas allohymeniacidonis]|uniref:Class A beta-lactamase-related serine hydrolase n=1 Tax=Flagellimonas allohymeniacidonis TaxID=2517819 RepID=A0A4Q8QKD1_9FLAO|nr:serine hydrolase domain-containing protein [Allomuricauda hymeniacidonis]TAI48696.1 class A beta-lactamase-related serine hydrolase [Allomuricauda hymeniacidonis]
MKKTIFLIICVVGLLQNTWAQSGLSTSDVNSTSINEAYPKGEKVSEILKELTQNGCPGASIALLDADGWWLKSEGLASLEEKSPMTNDHLHYLQSIAKTYMAVAVLKLYETDRLDLDAPITKYLNPSISKMIRQADEITVRMLLNHTSGIPEYNFNPNYATTLLQHPETVFRSVDYISYIDGKPLDFQPGSKYSYRNTNYVLLSMIVDKITGNHGDFIRSQIFEPLNLKNTYYQISPLKLQGEKLPKSYWDRYSNGILENVSFVQQQNVAYMVGDDGIVTTTREAVQFLKALLEGELLKESTLKEMMTWAMRDGKPAYGLGLATNEIAGHKFYGHTGGGLGAGCELRYFPDKELYMFIAINIGTVTESPLHVKLVEIRDKLYQTLLE